MTQSSIALTFNKKGYAPRKMTQVGPTDGKMKRNVGKLIAEGTTRDEGAWRFYQPKPPAGGGATRNSPGTAHRLPAFDPLFAEKPRTRREYGTTCFSRQINKTPAAPYQMHTGGTVVDTARGGGGGEVDVDLLRETLSL